MTIARADIADIGWAAGLFEGEGSIGFYSNKCRASLVTTDRDVLVKFFSVVGLGCIDTTPRINKTNSFSKKPQWNWKTTSFEDTQAVVAAFWRWLGVRRREKCEEVLLAARNTQVENKYRGYEHWIKGQCLVGHDLVGSNKYVNPTSGRVFCVTCRDKYSRDRYQRLKG